jgi:hypothetical protein
MTTGSRAANVTLWSVAWILAGASWSDPAAGAEEPGATQLDPGVMNYRPEGTALKDAWYFTVGDEVHCMHMQKDNVDAPGDTRQFCTLGHAATKDLISWRKLPMVLVGGSPGSYDDARLHTGCVIRADGVFHLFYTATSSQQRGGNRIALATSADAIRWTKHPANPLIAPDPRWYYSHDSMIPLRCHGWPIVDCRDPVVLPDPDGQGYWGFFAARRHGKECAATSAIALCHSRDLIHWQQFPPCFAPDRYACVEVPEVFFLDGRWYMLCLVGNGYGERHVMADSHLTNGTIFAVADRIQGPYREPPDNVLIGSIAPNGFAARVVRRDNAYYLFYTTRAGTISLPALLRTDDTGKLQPCYFDGLDAYRGERLVAAATDGSLPNDGRWGSIGNWQTAAGSLAGHCRTDWALHVYERGGEDVVFSADVRLRDARSAGLAFRIQGDDIRGGCYATILDAEAGEVILTQLRTFATLDKRRFPVQRDRTYRLKCVVIGSLIYVYIDDVLWLQTHAPEFPTGRFGLFVERGGAKFENVIADRLRGSP